MLTLVWINTLVVLAVVVGGLYLGRRIVEALARIAETAARNERLSLAILERITPQQGSQA